MESKYEVLENTYVVQSTQSDYADIAQAQEYVQGGKETPNYNVYGGNTPISGGLNCGGFLDQNF